MITWLEGVTLAIALWGAGLGTWTAVSQWRKDHVRVEAHLSWGLIGMTDGSAPGALLMEARNVGHRPVEIASFQLRLPDGQNMVFLPEPRLPCQLEPGQSAKAWVYATQLSQTLAEHGYAGALDVRAVCRDAIDRNYVSNALQIDPAALRTIA